MTDRQRHIYNFIVEHYKKHGYCEVKTIKEKMEGAGSYQNVHKHVVALKDKGFVTLTGTVIVPSYLIKTK